MKRTVLTSNKVEENCQCFTKTHFLNDNMCILNLKPSRYDSQLLDNEPYVESSFVRSILAARLVKGEAGCDVPLEDSSMDNVMDILKELKADLDNKQNV